MAKTRFGSLDGIRNIKKGNIASATLISAAMFLAVLVVFLFAVSFTVDGTIEEQRRTLENAIDKGIIQCYVTEGRYPESFEYLCDNYGIIYDSDHFRVDYTIYGTNMRPSVTVITLE